MNVVIMSRNKETLDQVAAEITDTTGRNVKVIVTDFVKENVFGEIEDQLRDLNIGVLVNNVGILPNYIPSKFLDSKELDQDVTRVINCNVRTVVKMCKMILPGMENRGKGLILNVSSGIASIPFPMYTLYAASKVQTCTPGLSLFICALTGIFHPCRCLWSDFLKAFKLLGFQVVAPFGVSTRMAAFQQTNMVTLSPEDFVQRSLLYLRAGDKTYGNVSHIIMGWVLQHIPLKLLYAEATQRSLNNYVKRKTAKDQGTK